MSDDQSKILNRVRKMLALAADGAASEGERDNAMRMAHATLAKHNLTMAAAEAHGGKPEEERVELSFTAKDRPWRRTIANAVAKLLFCFCYVHRLPKGNMAYYFIGKQGNAITASELASYLMAHISREEGARVRINGYDSAWRLGFIQGATQRIYERCAELRTAAERESQGLSTGTSLVLASVYATEEAANRARFEDRYGKGREMKSRAHGVKEFGAYAAGRQFGDGVSLNRQMKDQQVKGVLK